MEVRHNWTHAEVRDLMEKPFMDLLFEAQLVHRQYQQTNHVQVSTLLSIKTGACPEDCKYCPQSARYTTDIEKERLMEVERVLDAAQKAKNAGSTRFCMGGCVEKPERARHATFDRHDQRCERHGVRNLYDVRYVNARSS